MKTHVAAVVVSHDSPEFLSATLKGIAHQTRKVDQLIIIDTGVDGSCNELIANSGAEVQTGKSFNGALEIAHYQIASHVARLGFEDLETTWMWLLHDDSAPTIGALAELLKAVEVSPSVAVAGAKQVDWNDPKKIFQQGISLTKNGGLFSFVSGELDQAQHDEMSDVLAVGTAGTLFKLSVQDQLGGFHKAPLVADIDYSMRARLAGYRVIVVPQARVVHAGLSLRGNRDRAWLGGSPKTALRKAEIELRYAYSPLWQALAFWFFMPAITTGRIIWRIASKRPDRIGSELAAGIWAYFTIAARLSWRTAVTKAGRTGISALKRLRATTQQQRDAKRRNAEQEEIEARIEAHAQLAESDRFAQNSAAPKTEEILYGSVASSKTFTQSNGWWFALGLLVLSFAWWPANEAIVGGGAIPLGADWLEIFKRAGASFNPIGHGFKAPADAFIWVLAAISATTFWLPSLSIAILFFLAKPIAYAGAFKFTSLFTQKTWLRNLGGIAFALWPTIAISQNEGRVPALIAQLLLPWLLVAVAKAALLGNNIDLHSGKQVWSWVGLAALSLAFVLAAAPNLCVPLLIALVAVLMIRIKRLKYLIWVFLPTAALFGPSIIYFLFTLNQPLALLADPGVAQATTAVVPWQLLFGSTVEQTPWFAALLTAPLLLWALAALLVRRSAIALWLLVLVSLAAAWLVGNLSFAAVGIGPVVDDFVKGSPTALIGLAGLVIIGLAASAIDVVNRRHARQLIGLSIALLTFAPLITLSVIQKPSVEWSMARTMPAIVAAEARAGSAAQVLVITNTGEDDYSVAYMPVDGAQLEDTSVAYRFALSAEQAESEKFASVAELVANLISANGKDLNASLFDANVKYILVPTTNSADNAGLAVALDSTAELEAAGLTDVGRLWRVQDSAVNQIKADESLWSITKIVQLAILISFLLLALPSSRRSTASRRDSEIFIATEGGENE